MQKEFLVNIKGDKGDKGDPNKLSIGSVVTGATGTAASASVTGTAPAQILNLTLPRGEKGETGAGQSWDQIANRPTTFPPSGHSHSTAQVTGLEVALAGKAPLSHTHTAAQVTGTMLTAVTRTALASLTAADGVKAYCEEDGVTYIRTANTWAGGGTLMHMVSGTIMAGWNHLTAASSWAMQGPGMGSTPWSNGLVAPWAGVYQLSGTIRLATVLQLIWSAKLNSTAAGITGTVAFSQPASYSNETLGNYSRLLRLNAGDVIVPAVHTAGTVGPYVIEKGAGTHVALEFIRP